MPSGFVKDGQVLLAPYAATSATTRGRAHAEEEHPHRSPYQRDRDRIIHSAAFRRLENKTQVYTNLFQAGDYFRKRLTHTLEVAQIARSIARTLRLNEDLTEAVALCHDMGHAPFGHKGQDILHELMKNDGGFEHNTQALRIVCLIESRYPDFKGLNLTYEVREAIAHHGHRQKEPMAKEFLKYPFPTLEAQVVDIADSVAYSTHDLDDGVTAKTITANVLEQCGFWMEWKEKIKKQSPQISPKIIKYQIIRYIINEQVTDIVEATGKNLERLKPETVDDVRNADIKLCGFSPEMRAKHKELKCFLKKNMYEHYKIKRMEHTARRIITTLFKAFLEDPGLLPGNVRPHFETERENQNEKRIVCDYIAGMTDKFAKEVYDEL